MNQQDEDNMKVADFALSRVMYVILFIWFICCGTRVAFGERLIGHDLLAAQQKNFKTEAASKIIYKGSPVGILDFTFGDDTPPVATLLRVSKPKFLRVHLLDTVCVRDRNCGSYSVVRGYTVSSLDNALSSDKPPKEILNFLKARTLIYKQLHDKYPNTEMLISPALEHNLSVKSFRVIADTVKSIWPAVQLVNNGMKGLYVERYRNAWLEDHTDKPRSDADISSLDGTDIFNINVGSWLKYTSSNKITFKWTNGYNCRSNGLFIDPRIRTGCSDVKEIQKVENLK